MTDKKSLRESGGEIEVTPEMIKAGMAVLEEFPLGEEISLHASEKAVVWIYRAMSARDLLRDKPQKRLGNVSSALVIGDRM